MDQDRTDSIEDVDEADFREIINRSDSEIIQEAVQNVLNSFVGEPMSESALEQIRVALCEFIANNCKFPATEMPKFTAHFNAETG